MLFNLRTGRRVWKVLHVKERKENMLLTHSLNIFKFQFDPIILKFFQAVGASDLRRHLERNGVHLLAQTFLESTNAEMKQRGNMPPPPNGEFLVSSTYFQVRAIIYNPFSSIKLIRQFLIPSHFYLVMLYLFSAPVDYIVQLNFSHINLPAPQNGYVITLCQLISVIPT